MLSNFRTYALSKKLYSQCQRIQAPHYAKDQLVRAALSVCLNLAEGSGKLSPKEKGRFYTIALGSLREVQALLEILEVKGPEIDLADQLGAYCYRLIRAMAR